MTINVYERGVKDCMTYCEDNNAANGKNLVIKDTHGGSYKEYNLSSDGKREGGCGTSLNGMFRGDCKNCDHLDCAQCNWEEEK